jgi:hypothetical protein
MRGISWLAAKTGQLLKKDSVPWSKKGYAYITSLLFSFNVCIGRQQKTVKSSEGILNVKWDF